MSIQEQPIYEVSVSEFDEELRPKRFLATHFKSAESRHEQLSDYFKNVFCFLNPQVEMRALRRPKENKLGLNLMQKLGCEAYIIHPQQSFDLAHLEPDYDYFKKEK